VNRISCVLDFIRWKDWGAGKLPLLLGICFYIGLAERLFSPLYILDCLLFALFAAVSSAYGYLVNDLGDVEIDRRQGKPNAFANWSRQWAVWFVVGLVVLGGVLSLSFAGRQWFLALWLIWLALSTGYSLPPFRLKERGSIGLVAPALAQQALPVFIAFAAFGRLGGLDMWLCAAYTLSKGLSLILLHQRRDLIGDRMTRTQTFAARRGERAVTLAASVALELEKGLLWGLLLLAVHVAPVWSFAGRAINSALPLALLYLPIYSVSLAEGWRGWRKGKLHDPYHGPISGAVGIACVAWPVIVFPFYLLGLLTVVYTPNGLMLAGFAALHVPYLSKVLDRLKHRGCLAGCGAGGAGGREE
jgi:4-hydroxybenzoate polyprenyltransferase